MSDDMILEILDKLKAIEPTVIPDGPHNWYAYSTEIDYAAGGTTVEQARQNFEDGLLLTATAHIGRFGNINRLLLHRV